MRLLIDANILLDVLQRRDPHYRDSALVWKLCETEQAEGWGSALSLASTFSVRRSFREALPEEPFAVPSRPCVPGSSPFSVYF